MTMYHNGSCNMTFSLLLWSTLLNLCLRFRSLYLGVIYLYWSIFGLETIEPLSLEDQAWVIQAAGKFIYAVFYILVVVVLLNALIAVMSTAYNNVEVSDMGGNVCPLNRTTIRNTEEGSYCFTAYIKCHTNSCSALYFSSSRLI